MYHGQLPLRGAGPLGLASSKLYRPPEITASHPADRYGRISLPHTDRGSANDRKRKGPQRPIDGYEGEKACILDDIYDENISIVERFADMEQAVNFSDEEDDHYTSTVSEDASGRRILTDSGQYQQLTSTLLGDVTHTSTQNSSYGQNWAGSNNSNEEHIRSSVAKDITESDDFHGKTDDIFIEPIEISRKDVAPPIESVAPPLTSVAPPLPPIGLSLPFIASTPPPSTATSTRQAPQQSMETSPASLPPMSPVPKVLNTPPSTKQTAIVRTSNVSTRRLQSTPRKKYQAPSPPAVNEHTSISGLSSSGVWDGTSSTTRAVEALTSTSGSNRHDSVTYSEGDVWCEEEPTTDGHTNRFRRSYSSGQSQSAVFAYEGEAGHWDASVHREYPDDPYQHPVDPYHHPFDPDQHPPDQNDIRDKKPHDSTDVAEAVCDNLAGRLLSRPHSRHELPGYWRKKDGTADKVPVSPNHVDAMKMTPSLSIYNENPSWRRRYSLEKHLPKNLPYGNSEEPDGGEGSGCCGYILTAMSYIIIFFTFPVAICLCLKVVQEYERAVIFRLGRLLPGGAKGPGLFFVVPCTDSYSKVDLRTVSFDVPPQEILSKDSVTVAVDAVVYYRVSNATISITNVEDANRSTRLLAQTTLRNVLGTKNLSEILSDREAISHFMQSSLDEATDPWGVKVERVEVKDVRLPVQLQRAMAAEAEAARDARAKVIAAEGEQKASRALKEAADIMAESPSAIQLRYLQTLSTISAEKNSTIIFPLPIDMLKGLCK